MTFFALWVECERREDALSVARHFDGLQVRLFSGLEAAFRVHTESVCAGSPTTAVEVSSPQLPRGIATPQDAIDLTEAGIRLLHHLRSAPAFFYARVGVEPGKIPAGEVGAYVDIAFYMGGLNRYSCVLSDRLAEQVGPLLKMLTFRPGYVWTGYPGERYFPLRGNEYPQLLEMARRLLPE